MVSTHESVVRLSVLKFLKDNSDLFELIDLFGYYPVNDLKNLTCFFKKVLCTWNPRLCKIRIWRELCIEEQKKIQKSKAFHKKITIRAAPEQSITFQQKNYLDPLLW